MRLLILGGVDLFCTSRGVCTKAVSDLISLFSGESDTWDFGLQMNIANDSRQVWPVFLDLSSYTRVFPWLSTTRPVLCTGKRVERRSLKQPQMVVSPLALCFVVMALLTFITFPGVCVMLVSAALFLYNLNLWTCVLLAVHSLADGFVTYHPMWTSSLQAGRLAVLSEMEMFLHVKNAVTVRCKHCYVLHFIYFVDHCALLYWFIFF